MKLCTDDISQPIETEYEYGLCEICQDKDSKELFSAQLYTGRVEINVCYDCLRIGMLHQEDFFWKVMVIINDYLVSQEILLGMTIKKLEKELDDTQNELQE